MESSNRISKYMKQILREPERELYKYTTRAGNFNISLSAINKRSTP